MSSMFPTSPPCPSQHKWVASRLKSFPMPLMANLLRILHGTLLDVFLIWLHKIPLPALHSMSTTKKLDSKVQFHLPWSQVFYAQQTSPYQVMPASIYKILLLTLFNPAAKWLSCLVKSIQIKFVLSVAGRVLPCSAISMLMSFLSFAKTPKSCSLEATNALCNVVSLNLPPLLFWFLHSGLLFLALPVQSYWWFQRGVRNNITLLKVCITTTLFTVNRIYVTMEMMQIYWPMPQTYYGKLKRELNNAQESRACQRIM